jgi:chromosome segregation ATPase
MTLPRRLRTTLQNLQTTDQ